ncbi:MAG TPA: hypothetical protein VMP89_18675 [Solirubrobacteraceae bacterium]|nr:hypothetical protein [Solirubrobacteraceae bacterium]
MARIFVGASIAAAFLLSTQVGSSVGARPRATPGELLGTIVVDPNAAGWSTSTFSLEAGQRYRLVATGTAQPTGSSTKYDAMYCYESCSNRDAFLRIGPATSANPIGLPIDAFQQPTPDTSCQPTYCKEGLPYEPTHEYTIEDFYPPSSGRLEVGDGNQFAQQYFGPNAYTASSGFKVEIYSAGSWPPLPDGVVSLASVSNGCGGGKAGEYGIQQRLGNTSTFRNSNNPFGTRYTVHFEKACDLHDAGYSGAKVLDPINGGLIDYFEYTRLDVDHKFLADMRKLCEEQIPADAPVALADCKATGGKSSFGAETRYHFVRNFGRRFFRIRPDLNGSWSGDGVTVKITQDLRSVRGTWRDGDVHGEFRGTLISQDQDSVVQGFAHTSAKPAFSRITIVVEPDKPNELRVTGRVLGGTLTR